MDATAINAAAAYDAAICAEAEKVRDDMRERGFIGFVAVNCLAYSSGGAARWNARFCGDALSSVEGPDGKTALGALDALRDAIAEKLAMRPSLEELAATLGCEVPA